MIARLLLVSLIALIGCASRGRLSRMDAVHHATLERRNLPAVANHADEPPFLNGWPAHACFAPTGDSLTPWFSPQEAQLRVFDIAQYRAMFKGAERVEFDKRLADLKAAVRGSVGRYPQILPAVEAAPALRCNSAAVCGEGWKGVRVVTMYAQDNCLVENGRLFYTMQGLSDDERFWISAYWPVKASNLPALPGQITRRDLEMLGSYARYTAYIVGMITQLEQATYTPSLTELDDLFGKLQLKE